MAQHWTDAIRRQNGDEAAVRVDAAMDCPPCRMRAQQPEDTERRAQMQASRPISRHDREDSRRQR